MPDIFVVLEESTFDPKILQACDGQAVCNSALFEGSSAGREAGPLFVHTTAGGTALSEFTFLTGLDWRIFGPGGALAPLNLASHMQATMPKHLQTLGYQTIAIYPVGPATFLNAREAYGHYGFEHFLAIEDLDLGNDWKPSATASSSTRPSKSSSKSVTASRYSFSCSRSATTAPTPKTMPTCPSRKPPRWPPSPPRWPTTCTSSRIPKTP
ncbi:MAG: sulfatase-like hydrolase/transferase [Zoogloea sp.]|nr:sulfatase-like hydrolase/transferase [Zoogloea sp.]